MKWYIVIVMISITMVINCKATDEELFLRANQYYEHKEYHNALKTYDAIKDKGFRVWYTMGNCAYQENSYARARLYWERARFGAPLHVIQTINRNSALLNKKIGIKTQEPAWFVPYIQASSLLCLQLLFLVVWFGLFFLIKRFGIRHSICLFFLLLTIGFGIVLGAKYSMMITKKGIVMQDVTVYSGPNKQYQKNVVAKEGTELIIKGVKNSWYKVSYVTILGWVPEDQVIIV